MPKPLLSLAFRTLPAVLLLLVSATGAGAQSWAGDTALTLELEDDRGNAISSAKVQLSFVEVEPMEGPPPTFSNDRGEAQVIRLAEGRWRLDVTKEDFSNLLVVVRLEAGKKPVITAGPIRDAVAPPMKIKFLKSPKAGQAPPAVQPPAITMRAPLPEPEPAPQPVPDAVKTPEPPATDAPTAPPATPAPAPPVAPATKPEPTQPEPPAAPAPAPPPAPGPESSETMPEAEAAPQPPAAPQPAPQQPTQQEPAEPPPAPTPPAVQPPPPPAPEPMPKPIQPEPAQPEPAQPEPAPPVEAPPVPPVPPQPEARPEAQPPAEPEAPAAQPVAPAPSAPPPPVTIPSPGRSELRSFTEASCPGCKTGEWALTLERNAVAAGTGCPRNTRDLEAALREMAEAGGSNLAGDPAPLAFSGTVPAEIAPYLDPASSCQLMAVSLPPETKYTGYRYAVRDSTNGGDCQAGEECTLGEARWSGHPGLIKTDHGTLVWGLFENSSRTQDRQALFIVYLQPERGWRPGGAP